MGSVTKLDGFFNPDLDKSMSSNQIKKLKRTKRPKRKSRFDKQRLRVLQYFGLHDTATLIGICLRIHNETAWDMPGKQGQYRAYIQKFYRRIVGKRNRKIPKTDDDVFFKSKQWRELRFAALRLSEGRCNLCGARASDGIQLQVDHIKPRSRYPALALDLDNLQVLCEDCNFGKSNYDEMDFRV